MPPSSPRLSVLVISYETKDLTLACLASLAAETSEVDYEVLVVDNASSDGSAEAIAKEFPPKEFPAVRLLALEENLGFGAANNLAAKEARGELLLLLNPDTVVLDGAVDALVRFADQRPEARLWGGRTLFEDRSLNRGSCWGAPTFWSTLCLATGVANKFQSSAFLHPEGLGAWQRDSEREVAIVSGCFLLITRELWETLDGFHPIFFMYGEDADLCLRAAAEGAKPRITPDATIVHYGGASERVRADKMVRLFTAKAQMFRIHWGGLRGHLGVRLLDLWALIRVSVLTALRRDSRSAWKDVWSRRGEWRAAYRDAR